jgi:hypothetical protein
MFTMYGKISIGFFILCCIMGIVGTAVRNIALCWTAVGFGAIAAILSIIEARFHKKVQKTLYDLSRQELISTIQDYQEMVSEIEEHINENLKDEQLLKVRDIMAKYL